MICSKCKDPGILNHANGKEFYYCRTCKVEIGLEEVLDNVFEINLAKGFGELTKRKGITLDLPDESFEDPFTTDISDAFNYITGGIHKDSDPRLNFNCSCWRCRPKKA